MTAESEALLRDALSLPDGARAELAVELLASLDPPGADDREVVAEQWAREIERRARRVIAGGGEGEEWSDLRERLTDELTAG